MPKTLFGLSIVFCLFSLGNTFGNAIFIALEYADRREECERKYGTLVVDPFGTATCLAVEKIELTNENQ